MPQMGEGFKMMWGILDLGSGIWDLGSGILDVGVGEMEHG
jgi:hypothetical protein